VREWNFTGLTAIAKITVLWCVTPCHLVGKYQWFVTFSLFYSEMVATAITETSVPTCIFKITRRRNPQEVKDTLRTSYEGQCACHIHLQSTAQTAEMAGPCNERSMNSKCVQNVAENLKDRQLLEDLSVDGRIILKWILNEWARMV